MSGPGDIMVSLDLQVGEIAPPSVPIEVEADASKLKLMVKVGHMARPECPRPRCPSETTMEEYEERVRQVVRDTLHGSCGEAEAFRLV